MGIILFESFLDSTKFWVVGVFRVFCFFEPKSKSNFFQRVVLIDSRHRLLLSGVFVGF